MSYYILPKTNNHIQIHPTYDKQKMEPQISHSLYNFFNEMKQQLLNMCLYDHDTSFNTFDEIIKIINPYEYIFSRVPGSKFSVSKLKPNTNIFYDFLEIANTLNIFETYKNQSIKSLHISCNFSDTVDCIEMIREDYIEDVVYCVDTLNEETSNTIKDIKVDFIFYEVTKPQEDNNLNIYILKLVEILMVIFKKLNSGGSCLIKMEHIFHKPVIDALYLLSSMFEKVYIIKPNTSNITTFEKYVVCKHFIVDEHKTILYHNNYLKSFYFINNLENKNIVSLINTENPNYFVNKLDDMNIIIGQQQLEALDQIINVFKNKNKDDKIEMIKKSNIQKSVTWCEKYKIPCNKFSEKTNIFLPIIKDVKEIALGVVLDIVLDVDVDVEISESNPVN